MILAGSPLFAQTGATADVGAALLRFPADGRSYGGPWVRVSAQRESNDLRARASASAITSVDASAGVAEADAWWRHRLRTPFTWEAGGEADVLHASGEHGSASLLAGVRLIAGTSASSGLWLRGSGHVARRQAGTLRGRALEGGAWWRASLATVTASFARQRAQGELFAGPERQDVVGVVPVRYTEAMLGVAREASWGTLSAAGGARRDPDALQHTEALWTLSALVWSTQHIALVVSASALPDDFVHGADAARTFSAGLHFGSRPVSRADVPRGRPTVQVVDLSPDAPRRLRVHAPTARTVEVMADFTQWETVALTPGGSDFIFGTELPHGMHRLVLRIDGGPWLPPANLPSMDDDFGARVGVLVVP